MTQAEAKKNEGNVAYQQGDHSRAVQAYTEAINMDPQNAVLFRCVCVCVCVCV